MSTKVSPLKRTLTLRDLVLLNVVAVYTPSTLSQSLALGLSGLVFWVLAVLMFMLPYAAAIADLSRTHPREGGVYTWTRMAFGEVHGFACGWCYWVNTFLYLPSIFLGIAAVAALLFGASTRWIDAHQGTLSLLACATLWLSAGLHIVGLGQGKWLQNIGALGRATIALGLLGAAAWTLLNPSEPRGHLPHNTLSAWHALALWPFVLNAVVGLDLGAAMSEEADAPTTDIPRSLAIGGVAIGVTYLLTFAAALVTGVPGNNVVYGHVQAITSVVASAGSSLVLVALASSMIVAELLGLLGSGSAWLAAPARVTFAIGLDAYLPRAFARVHPRFGTPYVALLVQALAATVLILISTYGASLQEAYLALLSGSIVLVLITYTYLFAAWYRLSAISGSPPARVRWLGLIGTAATLLAIVACFIPPATVNAVVGFEAKIIGSVLVMLLSGCGVYAIGTRKHLQPA